MKILLYKMSSTDIGPELVTTNQQELLDVLDGLRLWGGGDCPESALNGILAALKHALPKSYVYIFTDAIAKDFALDGEVLSLIQKKQTSVSEIWSINDTNFDWSALSLNTCVVNISVDRVL